MNSKLTITSKPSSCISYTDSQLTFWDTCKNSECLNHISPNEICNSDFCIEHKEGSCEDANLGLKIIIGEPEHRGINSFSYKVQYKYGINNWVDFKEETIILENIENKEYFTKFVTVNTESQLGNNLWRFQYKNNLSDNYRTLPNIFRCEKLGQIDVVSNLIIKNSENPNRKIVTDDNNILEITLTPRGNLNRILENITYQLQKKVGQNWVNVEDKAYTSTDLVKEITQTSDEIGNNIETFYRVVSTITHKYPHLEDIVLYSNEVLLEKVQKPVIRPYIGLGYRGSGSSDRELTPDKNYSYVLRIDCLPVGNVVKSAIVNKVEYRKIGTEQWLELHSYYKNRELINQSSNFLCSSLAVNGPFESLEEPGIELRWLLDVKYKYKHLTDETIISDVSRVNIDISWRGKEHFCDGPTIDNVVNPEGNYTWKKREKLINGVVVKEENNIQDENYIEGGKDTELCKSIHLDRFDNVLLTFLYGSSDGIDLDIAVGLENSTNSTLNNKYVGFGQNSGNAAYINGKSYLRHASDDVQTQDEGRQGEAVIINFKDLEDGGVENLEVYIYAGWHQSRISGNFQIRLEGYKGGTWEIIPETKRYRNINGEQSFNVNSQYNVAKASGSTQPFPIANGQESKPYVGKIVYNSETKEAKLILN